MFVSRIFLALVGLLYLGLAIWCMVKPDETSQKVGFDLRGPSGQAEFMVVYGGLELGLALVFFLPLLRAESTATILLSCMLIHASLAACRTASLFRYSGFEPITYKLYAGECALFILSAILWFTTQWRPIAGESIPTP